MKSVGALDSLSDTVGSFVGSLTDTPELIEIGFILNLGEFAITVHLGYSRSFPLSM